MQVGLFGDINMYKKKLVIVSGGFDPIHVGHVRMIRSAMQLGDGLIIIVNNDIWIKAKKGYVFMPEVERAEIAMACANNCAYTIITSHKEGFTDRSVCKELREIRKTFMDRDLIFANGGDRNPDEDAIPEVQVCKELDIAVFYNVGGEKIQSSSELVKRQGEITND